MDRIRTRYGAGIAATVVVASLALLIAAAPAPRHTKLVKSEPAANDTLTTAPKQLSLWYSEHIDTRVSTFKLAGASGAVALRAPTLDEKQKDAPVIVAITGAMTSGKHTVQWTVASDDGHPVKGTFSFVVK